MRAHLARIDAVLVQAVIAAALSFAHLHDIANAAGQHGWKAWAYPVSVDLLLVAAWRRLRSGTGKPAAWCWFVISLTASLGANVATAGLLTVHPVPAWLRVLVAGWPAVAFLGGTLLAHGRSRSRRRLRQIRPPPSRTPRPTPPSRTVRPCPYPPNPPSRPPWSSTPARSPPTTSPVPATPSTPRPCAPASAYPHRSPKPSPPSCEEAHYRGGADAFRLRRRRAASQPTSVSKTEDAHLNDLAPRVAHPQPRRHYGESEQDRLKNNQQQQSSSLTHRFSFARHRGPLPERRQTGRNLAREGGQCPCPPTAASAT